MKAVITAAGQAHRQLPLQTMADADGQAVTILRMQLRELFTAGIEKVALVINPGDENVLREAAGELADFVECIPQEIPDGYGQAILCARDFVGDAAFLLSVSDHLFVSDHPAKNCFEQLIEVSTALNASVSCVQATSERFIHRFGTIGGERVEGSDNRIRVREVIEKPTPTLAEQRLMISGLRDGRYYSYFGIHVLQPTIFRHLSDLSDAEPQPESLTLTDAVNRMLGEEEYFALEVQGRRFDLEAPFGLLHGQLALALKSPAREQVLAELLHLVAER